MSGSRPGCPPAVVVNRTGRAVDAKVTVRIQRYGAAAKLVGSTAVRVGANGYVKKPVDYDQFVEAARQLGLYWVVFNLSAPSPPLPR